MAKVSIKNGTQHIAGIRDDRTVYIDGVLAGDVTMHPAFRNAVKSIGKLYDFQADPEHQELMTFESKPGRRVNRAWQMAKSHAELVERRKAIVAWAGVHHGFMGRSPDHVASALTGQLMGIDVFRKYSPERADAFQEYMNYAIDNDIYLTYVIINPQADRSKDWGQQAGADLVAAIVDEDHEGITIRGAKMLGTGAIMANEVFVANLQPLKPGEESLAFSCAIPMAAKGLKILSRKSYEQSAVSEFDNPLAAHFDENDALIYFDDVKVPWERVFTYRSTDACRAQFHDTPGHIMQNYQAQMRLTVKLRFLLGLACRITETIGTHKMPQIQEKLGWLAAKASMVEGMLYGMEAAGRMVNGYYVVNSSLLYAAQVLTQELYPVFLGTIRELAGGSMIMLPSSSRDLENPELLSIIRKTQISAAMPPEERVKFFKLAWDAVGSEFASRHHQYEMFYAGAQFITCGHSFRTFNWPGVTGLVDEMMSSYGTTREIASAAG